MSGNARNPLLKPKWLFGHALALTLVVAFINFGFWQLRRLEQARTQNAVIVAREALEPTGVAEALDAAGELGVDYLPVRAQGQYQPGAEVLLRGRMLSGEPGFHVLTPLVLDETAGRLAGATLLVERGWVPYSADQVPVAGALPPAGTVTVEGELRSPQLPPQGALARFAARDPAEGRLVQTFYVDIGRLQSQMPSELTPAYLRLRQQSPPQAAELPRLLPVEIHDLGPHLGYAIQWFSFALIGVVGYLFLARSVLRGSEAGAAKSGVSAS